MPREVEIKFRASDLKTLRSQLARMEFRQLTPPTHEDNTLFDLPGGVLRARGELLRVRQYGKKWTVTHKARGKSGRHKSRVELETEVRDGEVLAAILKALGFEPGFRYEKFRSEWADKTGHVVLDQTPIGDFGEIEGPPNWIDRIARELGIKPEDYITASYAELFNDWKNRTKSRARSMSFAGSGRPAPRRLNRRSR